MVDIIFKDLVQGDLQSKKVTVEDRLEMDDWDVVLSPLFSEQNVDLVG